jgi:hypothetical protein
MQKIQKWSRFLRIFFQIAFVAIPLFTLCEWSFFDAKTINLIESFRKFNPTVSLPTEISYTTRALCFMLSMIPNGIIMFGFYHLIKLFKLYESGQVFTNECIRHIKICAYSVLAWLIADFFTTSLLILALTLENPVGQRILSISLGPKHLSTLIISIIAIIIAQVMDEARKLKDENDYII